MFNLNCFVYFLALSTALAVLVSENGSEDSEEGRRGHKRRKRPCGKESPRWFFAHDITILVGDLTVVNSVPCNGAGVLNRPIVQASPVNNDYIATDHRPQRPHKPHKPHKPGLFGSHHHGGGLLGSHFQGGGLFGGNHQGGGLLGGNHQGGGLLGGNHQGGGLLGGNHQGGGLLGGNHQGGGLFGGNHQGSSGSNGPKPVYETMEEYDDTSTAPYRPGAVVGALSGQVTGVEQDLSHLTVLERINEHVGRFLKPFVDLFL